MKKIILGTVLISSVIFASSINTNEKIESEKVVKIWLENVFKMKSYDDYKSRNIINKKLLKYAKKKDIKYVNQIIERFWAMKNRTEKNDKNRLYNPQTNFKYSFKTKYKKYDNWRKKALVWFTIFKYQNLENQQNCNGIYLSKINGKWKI